MTLLLSAVILVGFDDVLKSYSLFHDGVVGNLVSLSDHSQVLTSDNTEEEKTCA